MHINTPLSTLDRMKMNKGITLQQRSWQRRHAHPAACDTINVPCREYLLLQCARFVSDQNTRIVSDHYISICMSLRMSLDVHGSP